MSRLSAVTAPEAMKLSHMLASTFPPTAPTAMTSPYNSPPESTTCYPSYSSPRTYASPSQPLSPGSSTASSLPSLPPTTARAPLRAPTSSLAALLHDTPALSAYPAPPLSPCYSASTHPLQHAPVVPPQPPVLSFSQPLRMPQGYISSSSSSSSPPALPPLSRSLPCLNPVSPPSCAPRYGCNGSNGQGMSATGYRGRSVSPPPSRARGGGARGGDPLIARLRGISKPRQMPPPITHVSIPPISSLSFPQPAIRDTSESLAMTYESDNPALHYADRPHACRKCSATFRRKDNLVAHIRAQHKGERPFKCEVCGFRFIKKDHAMKHWKVVHLKERPFPCDHCTSRFGQRSDLNKHVRSVHLRIKPFECEHCGMRFSHKGNQIRHQAVVHEKRKPFNCAQCNSSFAEKSNLVKHCQAVHKALPIMM